MDLKNILSELQTRFGFQNLNADANGVFSVLVNKKFTLKLAESTEHDAFYMYADVMNIQPDPNIKLPIYERTLSANLFGKETNDAYFAYDPKRSAMLLTKRFDNRLTDYTLFYDEFRDFIGSLTYWEQVVNEGLSSPKNFPKKQNGFIDTRKRV